MNSKYSGTILAASLLMALVVCSPRVAFSQQLQFDFLPGEAGTGREGNSFFRPFDQDGRFQQVYGGSDFFLLQESGGGYIHHLAFRADGFNGGGFNALLPNLQLNLSTTSRSADDLSSVFAENVGSDETTVFGPESVFLFGARGAGFSVLVDFGDHPFFYDPRQGNLLLDFRVYEGFGRIVPPGGLAVLDAFDVVGDSVGSVYASGDVASLTSGQVSSLGLPTRFAFQAIPEPSTLVLGSLGVFGLAIAWARKRCTRTR